MQRTERLQASVTPAEQEAFRQLAIEQGYSTGAELVRELIYDHLEDNGYQTSRQAGQGEEEANGMSGG